MPPSTIVPQSIAGLLAIITAAVDPSVLVVDGEPRQGQARAQTVVVTGWETERREPATFGLGALAGSYSIEEHVYINCELRCYDGAVDQAASRAAALDLFAQIESAVRLNQTLGTDGGVNNPRSAWIARHKGLQGSPDGSRGTGTQIDFDLFVEGRIQ